MKKNRKPILYILFIVLVFLIVGIGILYYIDNSNKLEEVLDCDNYKCKTTDFNGEVDYMFLESYEDYSEYKSRYNRTYPDFRGSIQEYSKEFFEDNQLVVFSVSGCGIGNIEYEQDEALVSYVYTDCVSLYGEVSVIEVKKSTESIRFVNKDQMKHPENWDETGKSVLECGDDLCKNTILESGEKVTYMFLDNYVDYLQFQKKYSLNYSEFKEEIGDYEEDFFKTEKLVVFGKRSCAFGDVTYDNVEAVIPYVDTDCAFLYGEVSVIEVKKSTESIRFIGKD